MTNKPSVAPAQPPEYEEVTSLPTPFRMRRVHTIDRVKLASEDGKHGVYSIYRGESDKAACTLDLLINTLAKA